jgi:Asp/Glu/hydantoin racemase
MKIIVVNVNTSESMTDVIAEAAERYASPGTTVVTLRPFFGAEAVDCNFESYLSAVAVMDRVVAYDEPYDAVILAGFGEHGRDGLQELIDQPVVEIDGIGAAVRLAEAVVGLGLQTSKIGAYAPPDAKRIVGWPLWRALGVPRAPGRGDAARAVGRSGGNDDPPR